MARKNEMRSYHFKKEMRGEWLVISGDKVVAHSDNLLKILEIAEEYSGKDVVVTKALSGQACFF